MRVVIVGPVRRVESRRPRSRERATARSRARIPRGVATVPDTSREASRDRDSTLFKASRDRDTSFKASPDPDGVFDRLNPNARALGDGISFHRLFICYSMYRVSECAPAIFQCNPRARRADAIRRVSGRGTDRDAACGDVIMNDDQAKKIKTDDDGASLIFFIYD